MKDFSTLENTSLDAKYETDSTADEGKIYSLFKKIETIEPFFVRRIPLWKRTLDIFGSFFGLIMLAPLFLVIAILIKIVSPGPVFFKQTRIGYGAKEFNFWKLRTMKVNADTSSHQKYLCFLSSTYGPLLHIVHQVGHHHPKILHRLCCRYFF